MRIPAALAVALFLVLGVAQSQEPPAVPPKGGSEPKTQATKSEPPSAKDNRGTKQSPLVIEMLPATDADEKARYERHNQQEKSFYDGLIAYSTVALAAFTLLLFIATGLLWKTTVNLGREAKRTGERQASEVKQSLAIARDSADAAINASKPFLFPRAFRLDSLHPLQGPIADNAHFVPEANFIFENYGETPGIVRQVKVDLILSEVDVPLPPLPNIDDLTARRDEALIIVQGRNYGDHALENARSIIRCDFRTLVAQEIRELIAENVGYRRFFLIGRVIYDDFFGIRTTQTFCLKLRAHGFQAIRGGDTYNRISREKISGNDPRDVVEG